MTRPPRIHKLGPNSREDSPRQVIVVDTETRSRKVDQDEVHTIRLWCARNTRRKEHNPSRPRNTRADGLDTGQLADWIETQVSSSPPVWVYCHNLSFDLGVTQLPVLLAERGWTITSHNLASDAPWAVLRKGSKTIRLADSWSVLPAPLQEIGVLLGIDKPPLPADDDSMEAWLIRCRADVEITMEALLQVMDWWDANKLGHWSITGPRTGFNAMRHLCVKRDGHDPVVLQDGNGASWSQLGDGHVVIHPDPDARRFERDTLYQGRREAWKLGNLVRGMYVELDMKRAHLTVARTLPLPCRRGNAFDRLPVDSRFIGHESVSMIADVEVETDTARYPVKTRYGIVHPVGRFTTRLAGPEIAEAASRGELRAIGRGYFYRLSYHMQPWAKWADEVLSDETGRTPAMGRLAVKGWSRSVPGTWAARTSRVVLEGTSPVVGWFAEPGIDSETGAASTAVHMAGRMQLIVRDQEADDSFPAVLSFIQSHVRVALGRILDRVPDHRLVTCSTDSVLLDSSGWSPGEHHTLLRAGIAHQAVRDGQSLVNYLSEIADPFRLAVKGVAADVRVLSPQHVRYDGKVRYSGVAKSAEEVSRDEFRFLTWPKLGSQMRHPGQEGYVRNLRTVDLSKTTAPRFAFDCGCTLAPRMDTAGDANKIVGPEYPACGTHPGAVLAQLQHPALEDR